MARSTRPPQLHDAAGVAALANHRVDARGAQPRMTVQRLANEPQVGVGDRGTQGAGTIAVVGPDGVTHSIGVNAQFSGDAASNGNLDRSRILAPAGAATPVAGRDDPAVLPGFVDGGSWHSVVAGVGLQRGKRDCNSAVRDHSAGRSRTPRGIHCRGKPAAGEALRHEPPSVSAGAGQRQPIMAGEDQLRCVVTCRKVAMPEPGRVPYSLPPAMTNLQLWRAL